MKPIRTGVVTLTVILCSSCSMLVYSAGKCPNDKLTRESARAEFGPPVGSGNYAKPRRLSDIPEFNRAKSHHLVGVNTDPFTTGFEDYRYRGQVPISDAQGLGMAYGMTMGLAEFWLFPSSISDAAKKADDEHLFRTWFSTEGTCVGFTDEVETHDQ